jgi:uncharacterized Zn finger protein
MIYKPRQLKCDNCGNTSFTIERMESKSTVTIIKRCNLCGWTNTVSFKTYLFLDSKSKNCE